MVYNLLGSVVEGQPLDGETGVEQGRTHELSIVKGNGRTETEGPKDWNQMVWPKRDTTRTETGLLD